MNLRAFSQLPAIPVPSAAPHVKKAVAAKRLAINIKTLFSKSPPKSKRELVAGGDIKWKPVDLAAARLLMKSPAINKPPPTPNNMATALQTYNELSMPGVDRDKTDAEISREICAAIPAKARRMENDAISIANNAVDAKRLMDEVSSTLRADVMEFSDELPKAIKAVRAWRMAITQEKELSLAALQDIRRFFLGADHEKEMARLENFIRACERMRSLAEDGTLSKVADVMLKLA